MRIRFLLPTLLLMIISCGSGVTPPGEGASGGDGTGTDVSFSSQVQPIFDANCTTSCHEEGGTPSATLLILTAGESYGNLVDQLAVLTNYSTGEDTRVVPGDSASSVLYKRISQGGFTDGEQVMPPPSAGSSLAESDQETIMTWIDQGAENN